MTPASKTQVGGDHYKNMVIQPVEFINRNKIGYIEGSVIKYVCRHRSKNGRQDLEKAKHFIDLLIEQEYGVPANFVFCEKGPDVQQAIRQHENILQSAREQAEKTLDKWKRNTEEAVAKAQASVVTPVDQALRDAAQAKAALAPKKDDTTAVFQPAGINEVLDGMTKDVPRQDAQSLNADDLMSRIANAKEMAKHAPKKDGVPLNVSVSCTSWCTPTPERRMFERIHGMSAEDALRLNGRRAFESMVTKVSEAIEIADFWKDIT